MDFLSWLKDFSPAFAVLVSAIAVLVSVLSLSYQQRRSVNVLRYEAVRSKRATAKAIMQEIEILKDLQTNTSIEPVIFRALCPSIGRLNGESIASIVRFYSEYSKSLNYSPANAKTEGSAAIVKLDSFLRKTEEEKNLLKNKLGLHD